ncbi:hypothetical protein [Billgrantia montanilacus]|uniref:hypothetical protein n=1 Tax=Billgrantia montanilacus TaxID=2282305 RepID=UPI00248317F8|nr:hypothetical protein [Halomonas montanilacus]
MSASTITDATRLTLMLNDLRLPTLKAIWPQFAVQADQEGWPAARLLAPSPNTNSPSGPGAGSSAT